MKIKQTREMHGMRKSPKYRCWSGIVQRTENPLCNSYYKYSAKSVRMAPELRQSFDEFLKEVGKRPSKEHSIDRLDYTQGYEKGNLRWATRKEQARNKSNNTVLAIGNKWQCIAAWAEEYGLTSTLVLKRLGRNWTLHKALTTPAIKPSYVIDGILHLKPKTSRARLLEGTDPAGAIGMTDYLARRPGAQRYDSAFWTVLVRPRLGCFDR
jgi:hypothetical protein